jgi:hypothetical protein
LFFAGFKQDSPGFLGTLRAVPDRNFIREEEEKERKKPWR